MRRLPAIALSLVALAACSDLSTSPGATRAFAPRPSFDAVALNDALPVDTAFVVEITMGESVDFGEAVLAKLGLERATDCRIAQPEVGYLAYGRLIAGEAGESLVVCNGGLHTRLAPEEGEDSPVESWRWAPFAILLRVAPQES